MRFVVLLGSLLLAFAIAVLTTQSPRPRAIDAPDTVFSAQRAMVDVRQIARAPHPLGSAEHTRVRAYLTERLQQDGFEVTEQTGALTMRAVKKLEKAGGTPQAANYQAINIIGVRPGTDRSLAPLVLMAHYDTVVGSPGAADDTTGVAAILETVRALKARGQQARDVVVVFTDAEEIGLEGARIFFANHPLAKKAGFVINLEARGGGGRAAMFETGRGDGPTVQAFAPLAGRVDGGVTTTSLAVFMYERMPNGTDFTHARDRDLAGMNFAFIGRAAQYHAEDSTPDNLDVGAVQHIGSQTLELADRLSGAQALPQKGENRVFSDLFGRVVISHPLWFGWVLLGLSGLGMAYCIYRERRRSSLRFTQILQGALEGIWFVCSGFVVLQGLRVLAGPVGDRMASSEAYYTMLRRLPWMEAGAAMVVLAMVLLVQSGARLHHRRIFGYGIAIIGIALSFTGGKPLIVLIPAAIATVLSLWPGAIGRNIWGSWLGLLALVLVGGCVAQAMVPEAALLFVWPLALAALTAVISVQFTPNQGDARSVIAPAIAIIVGGAWLIGLGHFIFLGIGISLPGVLAVIGLLIMLLVRPLVPARSDTMLIGLALILVLGAAGLSVASRFIEPVPVVQTNLP